MTDLLYLREPARRQALARVAARRGPAFLLDRTPFYATSHRYRHPQPADRGDVWLGGDKRVLARVRWHRGELLHEVRGTIPAVGAAANCHVDGPRRDDAGAAHAAMHLALSAFARSRLGVLTEEPRVLGGRRFAIAGRFDASGPALRRWLEAVQAAAARPQEVTIEHRPRDAVHGVDLLPYVDGWRAPDDATVRLVLIGASSLLPCDGTLAARTAQLGRIAIEHVSTSAARSTARWRVEAPTGRPRA